MAPIVNVQANIFQRKRDLIYLLTVSESSSQTKKSDLQTYELKQSSPAEGFQQ